MRLQPYEARSVPRPNEARVLARSLRTFGNHERLGRHEGQAPPADCLNFVQPISLVHQLW